MTKRKSIQKRYKALPPHTWQAHPGVKDGEVSKPLIISIIAILAITSLAMLLFFTDVFVGQAITMSDLDTIGVGFGGIFLTESTIEPNQQFTVNVDVNSETAVQGVKFVLDLGEVNLASDCENSVKSLLWKEFEQISCDPVTNTINFESVTMDINGDKAKTGPFAIAELTLMSPNAEEGYDLLFSDSIFYNPMGDIIGITMFDPTIEVVAPIDMGGEETCTYELCANLNDCFNDEDESPSDAWCLENNEPCEADCLISEPVTYTCSVQKEVISEFNKDSITLVGSDDTVTNHWDSCGYTDVDPTEFDEGTYLIEKLCPSGNAIVNAYQECDCINGACLPEPECFDGVDNDGDNLIDYLDPDCIESCTQIDINDGGANINHKSTNYEFSLLNLNGDKATLLVNGETTIVDEEESYLPGILLTNFGSTSVDVCLISEQKESVVEEPETVTAIGSCHDADWEGWEDGKTYYVFNVTFDSTGSDYGYCIEVGANDVTLDCNSNWIINSGDSSYSAILIKDKSGVTVKECSFFGFIGGIVTENSDNNNIINNHFSPEGIGEILEVNENEINLSGFTAISLNNSFNNLVSGNLFNKWLAGIHLLNSAENDISNNDLSNSSVSLQYSSDNLLENNVIRKLGITLSSSGNNTLSNNILEGENSDKGIHIFEYSDNIANSSSNKLINNSVCGYGTDLKISDTSKDLDGDGVIKLDNGETSICVEATNGVNNFFEIIDSCDGTWPVLDNHYSLCSEQSGSNEPTTDDVPPVDDTPQTPSSSGGGSNYCSSNWKCGTWSFCNATLKQTRTCQDLKNCKADKVEEQNCTKCVESWTCQVWTDCSNEVQSRTCVDSHICGTSLTKPALQRACEGTVTTPGLPGYTAPGKIDDFVQQPTEPTVQQPTQQSLWQKAWTNYKALVIAIPTTLILMIVLLIVLIMHYHHKHKHLVYNFDELTEWIGKERAAGTSDEDIRHILINQTGWTDEEVNNAFSGLSAS